MEADPLSPLSSPPSATTLEGVLHILEQIETFGAEASGRMCFGEDGDILIDGPRVCWVAAHAMRRRLSDRLRHQRNPPLTREQLESVLRVCRQDGTPVAQALVASGIVSADGLRLALLQQTAAAIACLGQRGAVQTDFVAHAAERFHHRFAFSTAEILAGVCSQFDILSASLARTTLAHAPLAGRDAFAFSSAPGYAVPWLLAVNDCRTRRVCDVLDTASLAHALLSEYAAPAPCTVEDPSGAPASAYRAGEIYYIVYESALAVGRREPASAAKVER